MASNFDKKKKTAEVIVPSQPGPATFERFNTNAPDPGIFQEEFIQESKQFTEPIVKSGLDTELDNRVKEVRQDTNSGKDYSVGLYEIDEALGYYFRNVIRPAVEENGQTRAVDIMYGDPERWAAMRKFGFYRDNKGKLVLPLIMYRKTNIARNEALVFPRTDISQLHYISKKKWDVKNRYDKFSVLNKTPESLPDKYNLTAIPNYITVTYECIIWTSFIEQMNKVIEKINFADGTYWGDKDKFKFRALLDAYSTAVELSTDTERMVKSNFTLNIYGYILPEDFSNKTTTQRSIATKKVVFKVEGDEKVIPAE